MRNPIHNDIFWFDRKNQDCYIFDFAWERLQQLETITFDDIENAIDEATAFVEWFYDNKIKPYHGRMKHNLR